MPDAIPNPADLLPHTRTARLLTRVIAYQGNTIEGEGEIPANHPLANGDLAPNFLAIEIAAQAAAALEALNRRASGDREAPVAGYLVRVRNAVFNTPHLPVATSLGVTATLEGAAGPMAIYAVAVRMIDSGVELFSATISTYAEGA